MEDPEESGRAIIKEIKDKYSLFPEMRGLTFEKPKKRHSLSECYANFLTILRIYRTTMINFNKNTNMRTVTLKLPDNIELNEKEISIMLSAQLYNLGKMSLGQAANHVDLNKAAFINELGKYNVSVFGETLEELEQEFLTPRKL